MSNRTALLEQAHGDLAAYAVALSRGFKLPPHVRLLVSTLEAVERGELDRVLICMPPRHGKSETTSQLFPAWCLGRRPDRKIMATSYGSDLATGFGRAVRNFCRGRLHRQIFPDCQIAEDSDAVRRFSTTMGGEYVAVGRVGTLTGRGGNIIIIDDPIRDDADARNPDFLKRLHEWYSETLYPRLEPGGAIVLVSTRWNTDDLAGHLLKEHASEAWKVVSLPALAEPNDPLGRPEGAALWPGRFPLKELARRREAVGTYAWLAQYQQRPAAASGNIFKKEWWQSYRDPPKCSRVILSLDTAFKAKESADYSVIEVWGVSENAYYLLHVWRARVEFPELQKQVVHFAELWRPTSLLIEDAASGQSLIQSLKTSTRLPVLPIKPLGDKVARASSVSPLVEIAERLR